MRAFRADRTQPGAGALGGWAACRAAIILGLTVSCLVPAGTLALEEAPETARAAPVRLEIPPEYVLEAQDYWYGAYAVGNKVGYLHISYRPEEIDGKQALVLDQEGEFKVLALGNKFNMVITETTTFSAEPPYPLLSGRSLMQQAAYSQEIELSKQDGGYVATLTEGEATRTMTVDDLDYSLADELTIDMWFQGDRQVGDELVVRSFGVSDLKPGLDTYTLEERKESMVDGVKVPFFEVSVHSSRMGEIGTFSIDAEGRLLSGWFGELLEIRMEGEEQARDIDYNSDLFVLGMAKIDKPLGDPATIRSLVLEVEGDGAGRLPDGASQTLTFDESTGVYTLKVGAGQGEPRKATAEEIKRSLEETVMHPVRSEQVISLARGAVADAGTPWQQVAALVEFVDGFIEDSFADEPLTVSDLIRVRKGDCTEHSMLFTTLARAVGIPSREVSGLLYIGDDMQAFGGHAWNEVVLDGHWVPVDATWGETEINATHINFGPSDGEDSGALTLFGRFSFALMELERNGDDGSPATGATE